MPAGLGEQKWGSKFIRVNVESGEVTLTGTILDGHERRAAKVVAKNVLEAKAVIDQTAWIGPFSRMVVLPEESGTHRQALQ